MYVHLHFIIRTANVIGEILYAYPTWDPQYLSVLKCAQISLETSFLKVEDKWYCP